LPDREQGFVQRHRGVQQQNLKLANFYREVAAEDLVTFNDREQLAMIASLLRSGEFQGFRCHYIATDGTHIHYLLSWRTAKSWQTVRQSTKEQMSRALNNDPTAHLVFAKRQSATSYDKTALRLSCQRLSSAAPWLEVE
jgi:hypothetical protein